MRNDTTPLLSEEEKTSKSGFKREITLFDAIMVVTGGMIGSGIFIVTADISRTVVSPGYMLLVWVISGFLTMVGAISYGELSSMFPNVGGQYVYLKEAYNKMVAFLYGWTLFLVIQTGVIAAVAVAFARFTGVLLPWFSEQNVLLQVGGFQFSSEQLLAIASIIFLTYINSRGVKSGKLIQNVFGSTKLIALFGLIILGLLLGINDTAIEANFSDFWGPSGAASAVPTGMALVSALGIAMVGALFSADSWNNIGFSGDEIVNPKRTIVLSMVIGSAIVMGIYLVINLVYLLVLPMHGTAEAASAFGQGITFAENDRVATAVAEVIGGYQATVAIAILIMISTFGCNNGAILSGARVYYAIAKDGLFFERMGRLNKQGVPAAGLWLQCVWACLLCLSGTYGDLLDYVVFAVMLFYILTIIGVFVLRVKRPDLPRPYKAFGYPVLPALYVLLASAICIILLIDKPNFTWPGLIIVALGVPVFYLFGNKFRRLKG
ncbi:APC family permease [Pontibacter akesuensis]|uniref:Amino acid/polyamine/organocation transporter, APC superfamily n=1 Tax=Pontibacter akesuensis TaxID=388950 RepID=A0A1I7JX23_9BACT|nr:amino acid permease [Pontibacter akesuensis]GHA76938.1 amino acid transporter [Pontibacter akesuensis]SFU89730.1 amino acid/polyamine/organocation transporter, APC superfamily [Pontibacter akesuensis]